MFGDVPVSSADGNPVPDCPHAQAGRIPKRGRMIISASKRTDIPAFYLPWLIKRMELGWVDVPNPMYRNAKDPLKALTHVSLLPKDVLAIVWWSKNYGIYERFAPKFEQYENQYFHFTINPRRSDLDFIEQDVPPVDEAVRQVDFLAELPGGPKMIAWRYDPLVFWNDHTTGKALSTWDPEFFASMCQEMTQRGVTKCFTSFADHFLKFRQRVRDFFPNIELRLQTDQETRDIVGEMHRIASREGMFVFPCTENDMAVYGESDGDNPGFMRSEGACIDGRLFSNKRKLHTASDSKMKGREDCACSKHLDIGDYVTQECGYGCMYCYANPNHRKFVKQTQPSGIASTSNGSE